MNVEFETHEIEPIIYLEAYLSKAPPHIQQAWADYRKWANETAQGAEASLDAYHRIHEQYTRLLAVVGQV